MSKKRAEEFEEKYKGQVPAELTYEAFVGAVAELDIEWLMNVEYQGLDLEKLFKVMVAKAVRLNKSMAQFVKDMQKIVLFYVQRGTRYDRDDFATRSKKGVGADVKALMDTWGIVAQLGTDMSPERPSVARIAILFAEIAAAAYNSGAAKPIFTQKGLPLCFCFPAAPSLMTDKEWDTYKDAFLEGMVKFTRTINRKKGNEKDKNNNNDVTNQKDDYIKSVQEGYAMNARTSSFTQTYLEDKRKKAKILTAVFIDALKTGGKPVNADAYDFKV